MSETLPLDISGIMEQGQFEWGIVSNTGIALKDETPEKEWHRITEQVCLIFEATGKKHAQAAMMLGDLLLHGETHFGETFADAIDATRDYIRVQVQTLKNWQWIAGKIPPSRRRENLSLSIHEAVARLTVEDQTKFLYMAEAEGMTVKELRAAIRESRPSKRKTKEKVKESDNDKSVLQKLIDCSNWYSANPDKPPKEHKAPLHKFYLMYRRHFLK